MKPTRPDSLHGTIWRRAGSSILLPIILAALTLSLMPLPAVSAAPPGGAGVQVPAGFPALQERYVPAGGTLAYRAFYAFDGSERWGAWTGAATRDAAIAGAREVLSMHGDFTHAFVEDTRSGEIVWASWGD